MLAYGTIKNVVKKLGPDPISEISKNGSNVMGRKKRESEFIGPKNEEVIPFNHISRKYSIWI